MKKDQLWLKISFLLVVFLSLAITKILINQKSNINISKFCLLFTFVKVKAYKMLIFLSMNLYSIGTNSEWETSKLLKFYIRRVFLNSSYWIIECSTQQVFSITWKSWNYTIWHRKVQNFGLLGDMHFQNYCEHTMQIIRGSFFQQHSL